MYHPVILSDAAVIEQKLAAHETSEYKYNLKVQTITLITLPHNWRYRNLSNVELDNDDWRID